MYYVIIRDWKLLIAKSIRYLPSNDWDYIDGGDFGVEDRGDFCAVSYVYIHMRYIGDEDTSELLWRIEEHDDDGQMLKLTCGHWSERVDRKWRKERWIQDR